MSDDSKGNPPKTTHPELFNTEPLIVNPRLATLIGLNEAIVLQQIKYWIGKNMQDPEKHATHFKDGRWWTFNTFKAWGEQFPFWSLNTVKSTISALEKSGILISGHYNLDKFGRPDPRNRTKWYAINYEAIPLHCEKNKNALSKDCTMRKMDDAEDDYGKSPLEASIYPLAKNWTMHNPESGQCYTETTINNINIALPREMKKKKGENEAKPIDPNWKPSFSTRLFIQRKKKWSDEEIDYRVQTFVEHHIEAGTLSSAWAMKFRGWCEQPLKWEEEIKKKKVKKEEQEKTPAQKLFNRIVEYWRGNPKKVSDCGLGYFTGHTLNNGYFVVQASEKYKSKIRVEQCHELISDALNMLKIEIKGIEFAWR